MNYQAYREWLKLREENKVPPAITPKRVEGYASDWMDSIRDGSCT